MFEEQVEKWKELDPKMKGIFVAILVLGSVFIFVQSQKNKAAENAAEQKRIEKAAADELKKKPGESYSFTALPSTNRNQGLEDLTAEIQQLKQEIQAAKNSQQFPSAGVTAATPPAVDLSRPLPGGVQNPNVDAALDLAQLDPKKAPRGAAVATLDEPKPLPAAPQLKTWPAEKITEKEKTPEPKIVIPINSALEGVMLTGINARPGGATSGTVGSSTSAINVGAPFVTKIKGDATLPNGWKLSDLGDCLMGGSGIAVLSAERAYAISDTISCVAPNGDVFEAPIKAYGVDADGIQGLAGKVVSKQGAILAQAFITGIASGLGTALAPTAVPGFNNTASGGSTAYQTPDPSMVARTAVGTGVSNAASQLSRFYLEFARETFPVIEVLAGTRITWILKESVEFKRTKKGIQK
ncbi:TrbI/VirB10 family protein [Limnohabitans curvus]|nr:TrbI/VirB10 family protein [Limnohabitans curvus]